MLENITTYYNILQHITTYYNILQHITTYYNILQHITTYYNILQHITTYYNILQHITTYYNILQHITTYYTILQHITHQIEWMHHNCTSHHIDWRRTHPGMLITSHHVYLIKCVLYHGYLNYTLCKHTEIDKFINRSIDRHSKEHGKQQLKYVIAQL